MLTRVLRVMQIPSYWGFSISIPRITSLRKARRVGEKDSNKLHPLQTFPSVAAGFQPCNQNCSLSCQTGFGLVALGNSIGVLSSIYHRLPFNFLFSNAKDNSSSKHCIFLFLTDKHDDKISGCSLYLLGLGLFGLRVTAQPTLISLVFALNICSGPEHQMLGWIFGCIFPLCIACKFGTMEGFMLIELEKSLTK